MRTLYLSVALLLAACTRRQAPADLIIQGGKIYTVNDQAATVEAVAVRSDTVVYAGDAAGANQLKGEKTRIVDLAGRIMTPGFIECHGHLMGLGYKELRLTLDSAKTYDEVVEKVKAAVAAAGPGEWIIGRGWHQEKWITKPDPIINGFQTHGLLSAASPNNPVYLEHASGHAAFVNAKAMEIAGILPMSKEKISKDKIEGGEIIRDKLGNPTGILIDHAANLVKSHIPLSTEASDDRALSLALRACAKNGITSFQDAGTSAATLVLYRKFKKEGRLTARLYTMLEGGDSRNIAEWLNRGPEIDSTHWLTIRTIKLHADGALGTRSAWLLESYADRPGFFGMSTISMDTVASVCRRALVSGFQVCTHAIGDRTNREILDRYEHALRENPFRAPDHRFRIEHAQHLDLSDIPRFGRLGVLASMQAIHLSSDRPWAIGRLGKKRIESGAYVWQSLLKTGAKVINGTDVPIEPIDPVACFYASVTRRTLAGEPREGFEPSEKMTRLQALQSYTRDAAYGAFEEKIKGTIEPGKLADFTVFSQDLMKIPDDELLKTRVEMTIVGGKVVYQLKHYATDAK